MTELLIPVHAVMTAAPLPGDRDVPRVLEIAQDHVSTSLRDADGFSDIADPRVRIPAHLHEHMAMV